MTDTEMIGGQEPSQNAHALRNVSPTAIDQMRAEFEAWGPEEDLDLYRFPRRAYVYDSSHTHMAWLAWQAAAELYRAPAIHDNELPPLLELPDPLEIDWPALNRVALGCGIEDRGIRDRYEAAEYGWEDGMHKTLECVPDRIYTEEMMQDYAKAYARAAIAADRNSRSNG
jgi:hypothetical protein